MLVGQEAGDNVLESGKPHYDIMAFIGSKPNTSELSIYISGVHVHLFIKS